jgi:hypothetical protein
MAHPNDGHWEALQQRSIALTGRVLEDLSREEAFMVAETLTQAEKAMVLASLCKPATKASRPSLGLSRSDIARYRRAVKGVRVLQRELRKARKRILAKLEEGC